MNHLIEEISSLKKSEGKIVADSYKVIKKILDNSKLIPEVLYYDSKIENISSLKKYFSQSHEVSSEDIKKIPGAKYHKGVIAVFSTLQKEESRLIPPFVVLNGVTSPENVGSIVRTISGLGFKSLVIDSKTVSPKVRRAVRVSMGNFVFLNIITVNDLEEFLTNCPYPIYATANEEDSISILDWVPEKESGFMIGSEGHGIDPHLYSKCKNTVRIPIKKEVMHLNAGHSCAIVASRYLFNATE